MKLFAGIDLPANNSVLIMLDQQIRTLFAKRRPMTWR